MEIVTELSRRHQRLAAILEEKGLDAALIVGNSAVGPLSFGCLRYFTDWRCYYHLQAFILAAGGEPIVCVGSALHDQGLTERGFKDIRSKGPLLSNVIKVIKEKGAKRIGTCLDMLPADWYLAIKKEIPGADFTELSQAIFALRSEKDPITIERTRICAKIADEGYRAVCAMAKPGVRMMELHAELDHIMMRAGAEEVFTLTSCGRFSYTDNRLAALRSFNWPDDRVIKEGDSIAMEITPRYKGCWTQLVRTVSVGEPDPDLIKAHQAELELIGEVQKTLKTGAKLGDVLKFIWKRTEEMGFQPRLPFGHVLGLDLDEAGRASLESELVLSRGTTVVLHPTMAVGENNYSIFWGDTFLVSDGGGERINSSSTDLLIL